MRSTLPTRPSRITVTSLLFAALALLAGCGDIEETGAPLCERGALDCPCHADNFCDVTGDGVRLICVEGLCAMPPCPPGTVDCPCIPGGQCAFGLMCTALPSGNQCKPRTLCPNGTHGCPCYPDEACDPMEDGTPQRCDDGVCVLDVCDRGERGCQCLPGRRCLDTDNDICDDGLCVEDTGQTVVPPESPRCYTPCQDDLALAGGGFRECSGEGLMAGCIGDALCVSGSCVDPDALAAAGQMITECRFDAVCPDFQTCIEGRCYSDCETDNDCRGDRQCHRKVCRVACTSESDSCGENEHCKLLDGSNGFCFPTGLPRSSADDKQAAPAPAAIGFRVAEIDISPDTPFPYVFFDNLTTRPVEIVFRKAYHDYYTEEGATRVEDDPMAWMSLAFTGRRTPCAGGALQPDGSYCFLVPEGEEIQVFMNDAVPTEPQNPAWARFTGRITATADDGTTVGFDARYARAPKGRWKGSLVYLGDYDANWVPEWQAGHIGLDEASNALVRRWMALRRGTITVDEFRAVMLSVANENWRSPELAQRCPDDSNPNANVGCYLYDSGRFGDSGVRVMSDNMRDVPIPAGVIEMPFEMLIEPDAPGSSQWRGRVDSTKTLHMPGDPAIDLIFDGTPDECPDGPCIRYIDDLAIDAVLGGRLDPPDNRCDLQGAGGVLYERVALPWLVPLFDDGTEPGEGDRRNRVTCRDTRFPGDPATALRANRSYSGANPYPDGRTLRRQVRLIDGAMIDQQTIFVLLYEEIPSFLQAAGQPTDRAYGYLMLTRDFDEEPVGAFQAGNLIADVPPQPLREGPTVCTDDLIETVLGPGGQLDAANAGRLGMALVDGVVPPAEADVLDAQSPVAVHYLCASTGRFDGGPDADEPCLPAANGMSNVIWFTLDGIDDLSEAACQSDIAYEEDVEYVTPACSTCTPGDPGCVAQPGLCDGACAAGETCASLCQVGAACDAKIQRGTCAAQLDRWIAADYREIGLNPTCECANPGGASDRCADTSCNGDLGGWLPDDLTVANPALTFYDVADVGIIPPDSALDDGGRKVHYLCVETGLINQGARRDAFRTNRPCPVTSPVEYFAVALTDDQIRDLGCQSTSGVCQAGEECARIDTPNEGCPAGNPACIPGLSDDEIEDLCSRAVTDLEVEEPEGGWIGLIRDLDYLRSNCIREARQFQQRGFVEAPACTVGATCNRKGTCAQTVAEWRAEGTHDFADIVAWQCTDGRRSCERPADGRNYDLRSGKAFVQPQAARQIFRPIDVDIGEAFRYKTRFRNRAGVSVGFAPEACIPGANPIPYCYDADLTKDVRQRVDCAAHIYTAWYDELNFAQRATLRGFLERTFAYDEEIVPGLATPLIDDGFERNYAELLTMLGDEAITRAYASRFDLAGIRLADFPGSDLEPDGIDLSGKAGFEMFSFYQGAQYFRMVLDRFFAHADIIATSLGAGIPGQPLPDGAGFVDARTATAYLVQATSAAYKKAQAHAEIAERYVGFNRPDLARHVIERAYVETYIESLVLMQVLDTIGARGDATTQDQIGIEKRNTQLRLARAMRQMGATYSEIRDEPNFFGIPNNFVPFPALDPTGNDIRFLNAFESAIEIADEKVGIAIESENLAFEQNRSFETDGAQFQAEMSKIKIDYDNELSEVCGTLVGDDGGIYPAIPRYAALSAQTRGLANPCGLVGNGAIFEAVQDLSQGEAELDLVRRQQQAIFDAIANAEARMEAQCGRIKALAEWRFTREDRIATLGSKIDRLDNAINSLDRVVDEGQELRDGMACVAGTATDCPTKGVAMGIYLALSVSAIASQIGLEAAIVTANDELGNIDRDIAEREILAECEAIQVDTKYDIIDIANEIPSVEIAALQASIDIQTKLGVIRGLYNDAASAMANREETEALRINAEVARNDPNVRVYRNAAYIVADRHFFNALREAYKATRVFEYYTSQSYAARDDLLLIRLAARGELNLRDYLIDLADAFRDFEQEYGNPDLRLAVLSLRDDVVPMLNGNVPMSDIERQARFVEFLGDRTNRDPRGYIAMPFRTSLDMTSPLTANHKIRYIQADVVGQNLGDDLGRLYVKQSGTGVVRTVDGGKEYYIFPERAAVLNASFNGRRGNGSVEFDPRIYRNERFRDRPLVNTRWEMILNTIDEQVNEDIDVSEIKDIVLYVYYNDFTTAL